MKYDYDKITQDVVKLYKKLLIPFMKIKRDIPFPSEPERAETDGEHAFTLSIVAVSLNERLDLGLDSGQIALYALAHDLVEAHAGDLSAKASDEDHLAKENNEREALVKIESDFSETFPWLHETIERYEARGDKESKFVYMIDKSMGAFAWFAGDGKGWKVYYPDESGELYSKVRKRLRDKVKSCNDEQMLELFDHVHEMLDRKREEYSN
jgi:5'-deoxynucleotidase YfbR-like HD superfamily hydrolase